MNKKLLLIFGAISTLAACSAANVVTSIQNSGFENGNLAGWKSTGNAFNKEALSFMDKSIDGCKFNNEGDFLIYGKGAGGASTGTLTSQLFKLSGNGKLGFLIGAGEDISLCYVELIDEDGNTLVRRGNEEFSQIAGKDSLHRVVLDASKYIGKSVRIRIVDNDDRVDGYSYLNVDDFIIGYEGSDEQVGKAYEATKYVNENKNKVNMRYRHTYHAMSPIGWANDPNGFSYFNNEIHLFHQFNPYSVNWGPMHWGHYTSKDFVKWELQPVALAPENSYDKQFGAFSGSAVTIDNKLHLMYTGVNDNLQQQCLAVSEDGISFNKLEANPVISSSDLPSQFSKADCRDPFIFKNGGYYYCLLGTKHNNLGSMVMYKSKDLRSFEYVGEVMNPTNPNASNYYQLRGVYECPAFAVIDGTETLICSPQFLPKNGNKFENIHSVIYMTGKFNYETGRFEYDEFKEIDSGFDFYAAQTMQMPDGRTIMTAWMQMWDRTLPTQKDGWIGAFILPRELTMKNGHLYQAPVREIERYRTDKVSYNNLNIKANDSISLDGIDGNTVELNLTLDINNASKAGVKLFKGLANETLVYYDSKLKTVVLDRRKSGELIKGAEENDFTRSADCTLENGRLSLRIFLDVSSIEVFINGGYSTLTANVYPKDSSLGIEFFSEGGDAVLKEITKYTIKTR